jgi:membrane protein
MKEKMQKKFLLAIETVVQYIWITIELFNKNGLANHAAAGAYGFLFSVAPALLFVSFFVSHVLKSSPEAAAGLIGQIGLLSQAFDMRNLAESFFSISRPGIAGFASIIGLLWTARIFTLCLQRGLGVIFPDTEKIKPVKKMMISVFIEAAIILLTFIIVLSSEAAFLMYRIIGFSFFDQNVSSVLSLLTPLIAITLLIFLGYFFVPANKPRPKDALMGTIFCIGSFALILLMSRIIFKSENYNVLYGTLGNLLILLVNVYFFFMLFYLGAELTFIANSFDALLLSRFIHSNSQSKKSFEKLWFTSTKGVLNKYVSFYEKEKVIFHKGEKSSEVYYILSGTAGVHLDGGSMLAVIEEGKFFGEMGHILSEGRSATIKAHTDLSALVIPYALFQDVSKYGPDADKKLIALLSERLHNANEKLLTPKP